MLDPRSVLSSPRLYKLLQDLLRGEGFYRFFVREYVRPAAGDRILDIGCGTADILAYLDDIEYVGFDMSERYIRFSQKRFAGKGLFFCEKVSPRILENAPPFDLVMANGILHHLDDSEVIELLTLARHLLKPGGRLVNCDGCREEGQSRFERFMLRQDRGRFTRTREEYLALLSRVFANARADVYHDKLAIPYPLLCGECS